jgi:hypothetical protein
MISSSASKQITRKAQADWMQDQLIIQEDPMINRE